MKTIQKFFFTAIALHFIILNTLAQEIDVKMNSPKGKRHYWKASWITHPTASQYEYGIFHFRNTFDVNKIPDSLIIYLSADNRYFLYINGKQVCFGPARGMVTYWRYETIDITPFLKKGKNTIAACVINFGQHKPHAQQSYRTALILQASDNNYQNLNTGSGNWKAIQNQAYEPIPYHHKPGGLYAVGPGDKINGNTYPWNWQQTNYDDSHWLRAKKLQQGHGTGVMWGNPQNLIPRSIPFLTQRTERMPIVRKTDGIHVENNFLTGKAPLHIPPQTKASILIDQTYLTIGFPQLIISKGKNSKIKITYTEAFYTSKIAENGRLEKGNRNEIQDKTMYGNYDVFIADGGENRLFSPLLLRTFRYIRLEIETADQQLTINDFYNVFTAYPYNRTATFETNNSQLDSIWSIGWRTQRLCAGETYFDCPYYEQMNYTGDTRVQALITLNMSADDRLTQDAITLFDQSRMPFGLTQARAPSGEPLIITGYSLFLVSMIHDFMLYRNKPEWCKQFLPGIKYNLDWFEKHIDPDKNLITNLEWWQYTDWVKQWFGGIPPGADNGYSAIMNLQYVYALQKAAEIYRYFNKNQQAGIWEKQATTIKQAVMKYCYDEDKKILTDTPEKKQYSQHTNIFAILTNTIPENQQQALFQKVMENKEIAQCSYYFGFYVFEALQKTGMGNRYLEMLSPWKTMLNHGLTTFAERFEPTRSDCHAWSANPLYFFMTTVCGIKPAEFGFKSVTIAPHPGKLQHVKGGIPHPDGKIAIDLKKNGETGIKGYVNTPDNLKGTFVWNGKKIKLNGGKQKISLE